MKFTIKIILANPETCNGCPCIDAEVDSCQVFDYEDLRKNNSGSYLRHKYCIEEFGKGE